MHYLFFMYFGFDELYVCCHFMSEGKYIHDLKWSMPAKFSLGISDRLEELWDATLWFSVFRTRGWLAVPWACVLKWVLRGNFLKNKMQLQKSSLKSSLPDFGSFSWVQPLVCKVQWDRNNACLQDHFDGIRNVVGKASNQWIYRFPKNFREYMDSLKFQWIFRWLPAL